MAWGKIIGSGYSGLEDSARKPGTACQNQLARFSHGLTQGGGADAVLRLATEGRLGLTRHAA